MPSQPASPFLSSLPPSKPCFLCSCLVLLHTVSLPYQLSSAQLSSAQLGSLASKQASSMSISLKAVRSVPDVPWRIPSYRIVSYVVQISASRFGHLEVFVRAELGKPAASASASAWRPDGRTFRKDSEVAFWNHDFGYDFDYKFLCELSFTSRFYTSLRRTDGPSEKIAREEALALIDRKASETDRLHLSTYLFIIVKFEPLAHRQMAYKLLGQVMLSASCIAPSARYQDSVIENNRIQDIFKTIARSILKSGESHFRDMYSPY
ncbi:uncharacterized protein RSE6_07634 [Rhynchosporium secalis]|uniref:Uncharacterized protein n=1 Tax=Rhynchosporium secalis TaxID=38038 RepID=A0A1E1MEF8_RHYSE|nr:uncharacterized protein RSE6_07634 [Rhynchosporium secalis]